MQRRSAKRSAPGISNTHWLEPAPAAFLPEPSKAALECPLPASSNDNSPKRGSPPQPIRTLPGHPTQTQPQPLRQRRSRRSATQSGALQRCKTRHPPPLAPPSVFSARVSRRITSHTPAPKPRKPRMRVRRGEVCSQRSSRYPAPPAIPIVAIKMTGSSMAIATWLAPPLGRLPGAGFSEDITSCRSLAARAHWPNGVKIEYVAKRRNCSGNIPAASVTITIAPSANFCAQEITGCTLSLDSRTHIAATIRK
jgi:hypothetical protein